MPRYRKLGYVALGVTDLSRAEAFYAGLVGLQANGTGPDGARFFRCGPDHHAIVLHRAPVPGLKRIGFEVEDVDALKRHLEARGVVVQEVDPAETRALHQGRSIRIDDPATGARLEFYAGMEEAGAFVPTVARIERLGHVVMRVPGRGRAVAFYTDVLGFRVSDEIDGSATFLRCNPYHHGIGLFEGTTAQLHHVNFMVSGMADLESAIARFGREGVRIVYGPGRHRPSGSHFVYFHEPDGLTLEYSYGMEEFPAEGARPPRRFESPSPADGLWRFLRDPDLYKGAIERTGS